jgi:hypothetical protein
MNIKGVVFAILFVVAGVGLAFYGVTGYQNQQSDIQQAVEVEGTVESTDINEISGSSGASASASDQYEPVVEYTYTYEGQEYTSESVYPGLEKQFESQQEAKEVTNQYSSGQGTTVYVNEEDPSRAFLIKETQLFGPFMMIIGGIFFVVGGLFAFRRRDEIQ